MDASLSVSKEPLKTTQQDKDENDEREGTVVKRKKPCNNYHVPKGVACIKLRAPRRVGEYVQQ